jgi:hypothetical protein
MKEVFLMLLSGIIGAAITAVQFKASNRRFFRDAAAAVVDEIAKASGEEITAIYSRSVERLRPEAMRAIGDIWRRSRRARFKSLWDQYCAESELPLNVKFVNLGGGKSRAELTSFNEARARLKSELEAMMKNAR